jgi:hypothetical protein
VPSKKKEMLLISSKMLLRPSINGNLEALSGAEDTVVDPNGSILVEATKAIDQLAGAMAVKKPTITTLRSA